MTAKPIRVLIADDHVLVRKGTAALLETEESIEVVGEASDGQEAVEQVERLQPDVVLMDLVMPQMDGIEATRRITESQPGVRILVLTSFAGDDKVFPALKAGAHGYLLKDAQPEELVRAIREVHQGRSTLDSSVARKVLEQLSRPSGRPLTAEPLTEREMEVLRLIAQGMSNREIADKLVISVATVRAHVSSILSKLQLASRTQAALYALREGLADLGEGKAESPTR